MSRAKPGSEVAWRAGRDDDPARPSALLKTSALAFHAVMFIGVLYLLYLGVRAFLEKPTDMAVPTVKRIGNAQAYRQGVLTERLNPKAALFFLAFLSQFVHADWGGVAPHLTVLGLVFAALSAHYTTLIAHGGGRRLAHPSSWGGAAPGQGHRLGVHGARSAPGLRNAERGAAIK